MKAKQKQETDGRKVRRDRYWSVMLVGEHGRIVPLKWFKGALVSGILLLVLAIAAAVGLGAMVHRQAGQIRQLESRLQATEAQAAKLRDEKDLYLTQYVALQKNGTKADSQGVAHAKSSTQPPEEKGAASQDDAATAHTKTAAAAQTKAAAQTVKTVKKAPEPVKKTPVKVQWRADIRKFSVSYDQNREVLKARFRIYNTSRPKQQLSGRSVVVFKQIDSPPLKWFTVPRVPITDGKPEGARGKVFRIKNYRTMTFRAYQQKAPIQFDTAAVFIFDQTGQLITEREFAFHIDPPPPKKANPAPKMKTDATPAADSVQKQPPEPKRVTESTTNISQNDGSSGESMTPKPKPAPAMPPKTPSADATGRPASVTPDDQNENRRGPQSAPGEAGPAAPGPNDAAAPPQPSQDGTNATTEGTQ